DSVVRMVRHLPVAGRFNGDCRFREAVWQARDSVGQAAEWQEHFVPGVSGPSVGFAYGEVPAKQVYGDAEFSIVRQDVCSDRFTLKLSALRSTSGLSLEFAYDGTRLQPAWVERWAGYFCTLLTAAVDHPELAISRLPLLNQAEQRQLLVEWNQTAAPYPQDHCLHELFETQAARTPERPALRFEAQELS